MISMSDVITTKRVIIKKTPDRTLSDESIYPSLIGKIGRIARISGNKIGVEIEGIDNPNSTVNLFWFGLSDVDWE